MARGRKPIGAHAMTAAERQARHRGMQRRKAAAPPTIEELLDRVPEVYAARVADLDRLFDPARHRR